MFSTSHISQNATVQFLCINPDKVHFIVHFLWYNPHLCLLGKEVEPMPPVASAPRQRAVSASGRWLASDWERL